MGNEKTLFCPPLIDTTAFQNKELFYQQLKENILQSVHVALPCKIVSYDRSTHIATVQVMFLYELVNGEVSAGPTISNIELIRQMAGGFVIDFPIASGDTGWLIAVDRDCYDVKQESAQRRPSSSDVNEYKTGFWIPDQWGSDTKLGISGVDSGRLTIQSIDGTQKISVGTEDIAITATTLYINGNVVVAGDVSASGTVKETTTNVTLGGHTHKYKDGSTTKTTAAPNPGT